MPSLYFGCVERHDKPVVEVHLTVLRCATVASLLVASLLFFFVGCCYCKSRCVCDIRLAPCEMLCHAGRRPALLYETGVANPDGKEFAALPAHNNETALTETPSAYNTSVRATVAERCTRPRSSAPHVFAIRFGPCEMLCHAGPRPPPLSHSRQELPKCKTIQNMHPKCAKQWPEGQIAKPKNANKCEKR